MIEKINSIFDSKMNIFIGNKWPRIFKNKSTSGWIKRSVEHLDEDSEMPDDSWDQRLNHELAREYTNRSMFGYD